MSLEQLARSRRKAFVFTEYSREGFFKAHSCGNGRFIRDTPSPDLEICFKLHKNKSSLNIQIHDDNLLQWLRAIPSLRNDLGGTLSDASISMDRLLPRYPEMSAQFDQDRKEGRSFDALELFVRHFLREGSVFATFGLEHLQKRQILTELHFHDIQSQDRSMSEDLDLLDEAIGEIDEGDIKGSSQPSFFMNEPLRAQLRDAIEGRDPIVVDKVLAMDLAFVDIKTLCLAIRYYERNVFRLLLEHGAQVGREDIILYRAAKAGLLDAVQLLLIYDAGKEGGDSGISTTALNGAASGGHLEIVQYLVEEKGATINGNRHKSPLARAIKHRHTHIINYLLSAGANVLEDKYLVLLPQFVDTKQVELGDILERFVAGMDYDARDRLFSTAVSGGHLEIVRYLVVAGVNVNPDTRHCKASRGFRLCDQEHSSPLAVAALRGYLEIVRCLVVAGADVNLDVCFGCDPAAKNSRCIRPQYSPLAAAIKFDRSEVAQFLSSCGATLLKCEGKGRNLRDVFRFTLSPFTSVDDYCDNVKHFEAIDVNDCPAVAAIRAQERRTMARRLLAKVANSCEKLLDASITQGVSAKLIAFAGQVGSNVVVWRNGTRAIQDICEGYKPRRLSDIVSALQVANAMRSVVSPSRIGYSKKEFIDDIPRWASLLSQDDQHLFFEIASYLWGNPASTVAYEMEDSLTRPLMSLQDIVNQLVRTSGLFDHGSGISYRLQTLRQQYLFGMPPTLTCERRPTLAEWDPLAKQTKQGNPSTNAPKPPDPEEEKFSILARMAVLMAGAIFGVILLYLCLFRYGFSTLRMPILTSDAGQGWTLDQIITRNNVILAMYVGFMSPVDFESCKSTDHLVPDSPPTKRAQEHMATVQASYEGDYPMIDSSSVADTMMDCSPSVSSHLTTSSPATTVSSSSMATTTPDSTTTCTSMDGTISCEYCNSKFKLGKNGRRGQASNLQKHMKIHHPRSIPNYHRVIYDCRYGCGTRDPNKSNIKAHENKHCANRKGKQPRCHGKWRQTIA